MKPLVLATASFLFLVSPTLAADLDGPTYRERTYIERSAPPVVLRERIIEHHYYEPRVETYAVPRVYERPVYGYRDPYYYDEPYRYRRAYFVGRPFWRHRHQRGRW